MDEMTANRARAPRDKEFVRELERLINASDKTQTDIAEEIGYDNVNMITMFKSGRTRVPMEKVVPLCEALGADGGHMLRRWFNTYMPNALQTIHEQLVPVLVTRRERGWLAGLRRDFGAELLDYDASLVSKVTPGPIS